MTTSDITEAVDFLLTHSTTFDTLLVDLERIVEKDRPAIQRALQERAEAAVGAGRPAEAELLAFLTEQTRQAWQPRWSDTSLRAFSALLDQAVRLDGLLDAFLAFRCKRAVLPDDPVTAAQKLLGSYHGIPSHQRSAVLAALAMAAPDTPLSAVRARTWWAFGLMERAALDEARGRADVLAMRHRRHALFHADRAVVELHRTGCREQNLEVAYWAYGMLARAHRSLGDFRKGLSVLLDCQRQLRHLDDDRERWLEFDRILAIELSAQGHHRASLFHFDQALSTFRDFSDDRPHAAQVDLLIERGKAHVHNGTLAAATADFRRAAETADALSQAPTALRARALWASSLELRGRSREALRIFKENLTTALRSGTLMPHTFRCALAQQLRTMGYLDEAEKQYRLALAEMRQGTHTRHANEVGCLFGLGQVAEARGDHDQAMTWYQESRHASSDYRLPIEGTAILATELGRIRRDGTRSTAQQLLPQLTQLRQDSQERGDSSSEFITGHTLMSYLSHLGCWAEAADLGRQLIAEADRRADRYDHDSQPGSARSYTERRAFVTAFRHRPDLLDECLGHAQWCRDAALREIDDTPWPVQRAEAGGQALDAYEDLLALFHDHGGDLTLPDDRPVLEQCFDLHEEVKARDLLTDLSIGPLPSPQGVPAHLLAAEQQLLTALRHDLTRSTLSALGIASEMFADRLTTLSAVHKAISGYSSEYVSLRQGAVTLTDRWDDLLVDHAVRGRSWGARCRRTGGTGTRSR
ncbi:hypothetical protein OK006_8986 [Actinobacteria bacterium OK006]|nr:hypothetical protein OK006_8986 [Actinobacteria bacterium OK006]